MLSVFINHLVGELGGHVAMTNEYSDNSLKLSDEWMKDAQEEDHVRNIGGGDSIISDQEMGGIGKKNLSLGSEVINGEKYIFIAFICIFPI